VRCTTVHVLLLLAIIFIAELSVIEYCAATEPMAAADYRSPDDRFIHTVDRMLGTNWYGIYFQGKKVGYGKLTSSREKGSSGVTYRFSLTAKMTLQSGMTTHQMKMDIWWRFDGKPPYALIEHTVEMSTGKDISEIKIVKEPYGYQAKILQGNETRTAEIELFNFSLQDHLAVESWIQAKPQSGDRIEYSIINTNTLKIDNTAAKIREIRDAMVNGIKITYYTIINTFAEGIEIVSVHGADGMPYTMSLGKLFEFRLEPEALAVKIDKPTDLFFRNLVRISIALGNPERVIRLKLGIDKASGALIGKAPGQTVESDIANGRYIVSNAPGGDPRITATFDETQKNLAATTEIPINHPKVVSLAKEAVFGADTTADKVARLVRFVQLYIEDDLSAEPLTLLDVIVRRKGDCSEHALLFTALARSLAIPCRMVAGLVYGGDTLRAFSPHAWNEVVVNGQWIPVDPTWGQTTIDATHLRFPASANDWYQVLGTVPNMKITVVDFEIK
jgi:hypothetical protein